MRNFIALDVGHAEPREMRLAERRLLDKSRKVPAIERDQRQVADVSLIAEARASDL
jgi:hypothetical protein